MPDTAITSTTGLLLRQVVSTLMFVTIGIVTFLIVFFIITKITPFSIRKEIEEDQNTALAILIGAVMLGLAQIIAAAIHG
jgi:putative membrane protein